VPEPSTRIDQPQTFEQLLTPLLDSAFGLAFSLSGNRTDAEDLVQEAALAALRGFKSFQAGSNFKAWFFRILTNCFYGNHRQRKRRPQTVDFDDVPELYMYIRTLENGLHRLTENPAALVMERLDVEHVHQAIEALPAEYRAVAALYFVEDLRYEEIAEVLGCPVGTVRSRLHRGRRMLQKALWSIAVEEGIVSELTGEKVGA
jgi:RNA polymerase sigma-70 factor (ECF subfamily)